MKILSFIKQNNNWKELLSNPPYSLKINENEEGYVILNYNMIESDFNEEIVREARGIIFNLNNIPVCIPFFKFFNREESMSAEIDWESSIIQSKIDGSIIKLWYDNYWHISTNGTIDAFKTPVGNFNKTFGFLFLEAMNKTNLKLEELNKDYTYIFELVSLFNKIVVNYPEIKIYHIGTRDNITFKELSIDIGIEKPKEYKYNSISDMIEATQNMKEDEEGYVVVDKNFNRVKVKSPLYCQLHRQVNNHILTKVRLLEIILIGEQAEFVCYFPEYNEIFYQAEKKLLEIIKELEEEKEKLSKMNFENKKEFALMVKDKNFSHFYFAWWANRDLKAKDFITNLGPDRLEKWI